MIGVACFNIIKALVVRGALALHAILTIWRVTENLDDQMYWLLCCLMVPFLLEGLYTIVYRKGKEYLWFSPCFFFYLCATLPPIWLLELDKSRQVREDDARNVSSTDSSSSSNSNDTSVVSEQIPISLNPNMWTIVIEEMLLYLLVIGRWILPRGAVTREQLSELLFAFIGIAADVMEFFSLFGEPDVRKNEILGYCLLGIWSLSILQFTMAVTVTQQPKRGKKIKTVRALEAEQNQEEKEQLSTELGAIFVSMVMQDVPFLVLRLYTIITYNLITYSLIFFTSKNVLVIALLFYKIAVILQKRYCPETPESSKKNDDEEKIIGKGLGKARAEDDNQSKKSSSSKYALEYEYAGVVPTPTAPNHSSASGSPRQNGSGDLTHRKAQMPSRKTSPSDSKTPSPNGQAMSLGKENHENKKNKRASAAPTPAGSIGSSAHSPSVSSKAPSEARKSGSGSVTPDTPRSMDGSETSKGERPQAERPAQLEPTGASKDPVILTPPKQTAEPGDPDFQPYVSVVKL